MFSGLDSHVGDVFEDRDQGDEVNIVRWINGTGHPISLYYPLDSKYHSGTFYSFQANISREIHHNFEDIKALDMSKEDCMLDTSNTLSALNSDFTHLLQSNEQEVLNDRFHALNIGPFL